MEANEASALKRPRFESEAVNSTPHCRKLAYHGDDASIATSSFLSVAACSTIVSLCEAHASEAGRGWRGNSDYEFSTVDLEVDKVPMLVDWLKQSKFMNNVVSRIKRAHGVTIRALDDCFVVKYSASGDGKCQTELPRHTDAGDFSFMTALSNAGADYAGGGTKFDALDEVLHLPQGHMVTFDANLFHRGMPITRGFRYLLVGFCHVDEAAALEPGNLTLDFQTVAPRFPGPGFDRAGGEQRSIAASWSDAIDFGGSSAAALHRDACTLFEATEGTSHWLSRGQMQSALTPRSCALEALVASVFGVHFAAATAACNGGKSCDRSDCGGAEYWVQMCAGSDGIPLHYDKDEEQAREAGDGAWRHPKVATVTYLTDGAAPTVVFDTRRGGPRRAASRQAVDDGCADGPSQAFVSFPRAHKHLAFSGKLLHGVSRELNFDLPPPPSSSEEQLPRRVTLLVNIWTREGPNGVGPLPPAVAARLSQLGSPRLRPGVGSNSGDAPAVVDTALLPLSSLLPLDEHAEGMTLRLPVRELWAMGAWRRGHLSTNEPAGGETLERGVSSPNVRVSSCLVLAGKSKYSKSQTALQSAP